MCKLYDCVLMNGGKHAFRIKKLANVILQTGHKRNLQKYERTTRIKILTKGYNGDSHVYQNHSRKCKPEREK